MKITFAVALCAGYAAALGIESQSQLSASMKYNPNSSTDNFEAGESQWATCMWSTTSRYHRRVDTEIVGEQTPATDGDTTADNYFWFNFTQLKKKNNTIRVKLETEDKWSWSCPSGRNPAWTSDTHSNNDESNQVAFTEQIPSTALKLLTDLDTKKDLVLRVEAYDKTDNWETLGCCLLEKTTEASGVGFYNEHFGAAGLSQSPALAATGEVDDEYDNPSQQAPPVIPATGRVTEAFDWRTIETCKDYGVTADKRGVTKYTSDAEFDMYYNDGSKIPNFYEVVVLQTDTGDYCAGFETVFNVVDSDDANVKVMLGDQSSALVSMHETYPSSAPDTNWHVTKMQCSEDSVNSDAIACEFIVKTMDENDGTTTGVQCGNVDAGGKTDLSDASGEGTMTKVSTWIKDSDQTLVGVRYCEVLVHRAITWNQYLHWVSESIVVDGYGDFTSAEATASGATDQDYTKGPYQTEYNAAVDNAPVLPVIKYIKAYELGGLCVGFDIIYWSAPEQTYSFYSMADISGATPKERCFDSTDYFMGLFTKDDSVNDKCLALSFLGASDGDANSAFTCGAYADGTQLDTVTAYGGGTTPLSSFYKVAFEAAETPALDCVIKIDAMGQIVDDYQFQEQIINQYKSSARPSDTATTCED